MRVLSKIDTNRVSAGYLTESNQQALLTAGMVLGAKAVGEFLVLAYPALATYQYGAFFVKHIFVPSLGILGTAAGFYVGNELYKPKSSSASNCAIVAATDY